ncbi:helix-turn-helix transcriptional regulator [Nonomuraea lactucae]|uniref:helix-turn-helix transcriptional regulator n=1 Tax=Nonomuraea lactucae TaxID=2249762 RepID=UPI0013B3CDD8|nr:LuxR family transcriptional regulator [Nonomuraea lactucae]
MRQTEEMLECLELLERESELRVLDAAARDARAGRGRFIVVEGAAGLGKTRLLDQARMIAAADGLQPLRARGVELERGFGFGVVRQLFEPVLAATGDARRRRLFEGAAGQASVAVGPPEPGEEPVGDFAVLHGLYWLTANLCREGPVAFVVDDLHWADPVSLRFLAHLLPRLAELPLLVVAGTRPAGSHHPDALLTVVSTDPEVTVLRPAPLGLAAAAVVVREIAPDAEDEFCAECHALTGGNPLLLHELAASAVTEGIPRTVEGLHRLSVIGGKAIGRRVARQLSALGPDAAGFARAAAIMGEGATLPDTATVAGLDVRQAAAALRLLAGADILHLEEPIGFVHPLVRAAVYESMGPGDRAWSHRLAARVLGAGRNSAQRVAAHLLRTVPTGEDEVVRTLRQAAEEALAHASPSSALDYLERALRELHEPHAPRERRAEVYQQAGTVAQHVDWRKAVDYLREGLVASGRPDERAEIADLLGRALFVVGRHREAVTVYEQAISRLGGEHVDLRRRLQAGLINVAVSDLSLRDLSDELIGQLRDAERDQGLGSRMLDALISCKDAMAAVGPRRAVEMARRALDGGTLVEQANGTEAFIDAVWVLITADRDEAVPVLETALAQAHHNGSSTAAAALTCFRSLAWLRRGALAEAEADARQAIRLTETAGVDVIRPFAAGFLGETLLERGRLDDGTEALAWGRRRGLLDTAHGYWLLLREGRFLIERRETERGLAVTVDCGRRFEAHGWHNPAFLAWRSQAAVALAELGRDFDARRMAGEELELARRCDSPGALGRALRITGRLTGGDAGLAMLHEAVEVLKPTSALLEQAKALHALGSALHNLNRRAEARGHLTSALDLADRCGAAPLVDKVRAKLRAAGGRPRRAALFGLQALTPSERQVADLAVAGHSNRGIAQALFITVKTVEVHLGNVYRKLDVKHRNELAKVMAKQAE